MQRCSLAPRRLATLLAVGGSLFPLAGVTHAEITVVRQVSTGDIAPTLFAQVRDGGAFEPVNSGSHFLNDQLFTPALRDGSLAYITSSTQVPGFDPLATFSAGLYVIDDLVPQLHSDGSTNLNVKPIAHGVTDPVVGVFDNGPGDPGRMVGFDTMPNAISISGGSVSVLTHQQQHGGSPFGVYEGTTTATTTEPVPAMGVVVDQNTSVLPGTTVRSGAEISETGVYSFARDGARTVSFVDMQDGRNVLMTHEGGVRQNLLVSGGGAEAIDLPDGPFQRGEFIDAENGQIAFIANDTKVYRIDAGNNASLLADSGGQELSYISLDGDDVVVGRHEFFLNAFNPTIQSATRGGGISPDGQLLGERLEAISRVEDGLLVDLVNENTTFPDAGPHFGGFGPFSYSDGNLAFIGSSTDRGGLFVLYEGSLHKVLEIGDTLEGKPVLDVNINRYGLDGDMLGFIVTHALNQLPSGFTEYDQSIYTMSLAANFAGLPGDFDGDSDVDGFDLLGWQRGESPDPLSTADLETWQANFGAFDQFEGTATAIPEPTSQLLAILAAWGATRRRPRRCSGRRHRAGRSPGLCA